MGKIKFCLSALEEALIPGVKALVDTYHYEIGEEGILLSASKGTEDKLKVSFENNTANIIYYKKIHFFRGLGLLLEELEAGQRQIALEETPQFDTNGAMFDVSQGNAVLNVGAIQSLLRRMAVMGLNLLMMYCEDSYDVPEEAFFGYMRPRYTQEDLKRCDDYADMFGIEMVPCIQTLAHLTDTMVWSEYADIREDKDTLLVGEEKTYTFIEHLIRAASRPFRSKRIHIGMDEAWRLGMGQYYDLHGAVDKFKIMQEHLNRVLAIVRKLGLEPMMWSDMFFRSLNAAGEYYDTNIKLTDEVVKAIPQDVALVYWDYYHEDKDFYRKMLDNHQKMGHTIFAGGIWTWIGFGANWGITRRRTDPALEVCKEKGIREVFATIWGDNGTESNAFANMMGLSLFAEHGYSPALDEAKFRRRFAFCAGANFDDFDALKLLDEVPGTVKDNMKADNPSKYLLWQDPLLGMFDRNIQNLPLNEHYKRLAKVFEKAVGRNGEYDSMFAFYAALAAALAQKAELGLQLTAAYQENNREKLSQLSSETIPAVLKHVEQLRSIHRANWAAMNKMVGWEIMDMRYGSLIIRLRSAMETVQAFLNGKIDRIEELDEKRLPYNGKEGLVSCANFYGRIVSASRIAPEA